MKMKSYYYGDPDSDTVLIQLVDDHDLSVIEQEISSIRGLTDYADFRLIAVKTDDWNNDLSPWPAPAVFGKESFGGGAPGTLTYLTEELLPELKKNRSDTKDDSTSYFIGGYSFAGLFALWSVCQSTEFDGAAAVSPSVWFPGFAKYISETPIRTDTVYLSLGSREEKTRNKTMSQVGNAIREISQHLQNTGINCTLEWNKGNHFRDPDLRTAKGFAWLINQRNLRRVYNNGGNNAVQKL